MLDYGGHWDYPKGHVEPGEDDRSAALRELAEETGLDDVIVVPGFSRRIEYFFRSQRHRLIRKRVTFLLVQAEDREIRLSDEHVGFAWLAFDDAVRRLTHGSAKQILRDADAFIRGGIDER